jgi:signal transduction histidine kinase/ActR/RegA family two-component response regulator
MAIIKALLEKDTSLQEIVTRRVTKDGVLVDVIISSSMYDDHEGLPVGVLAVIRDITEMRRLEAQLQHAQKMESIGTIASGVAHNFRNILAGVSVDSQLLHIKHGKDPAIAEIAHRMNRYVKRGTNLVEGLMQFARKPREYGFDRVDLSKILKETHDLICQSFDNSIEIEHSISDFVSVLGDDTGLQQVFMNLCTNARDAMPDGGKLLISAEARGDWAEIEITDTGEGMDPETQKKCFDPFFTTKGVHRGTGLGLSTSYGIIKNHGGEVALHSAPGEGTTFTIHLPLLGAEPDDEPTEENIWSPIHGGGRKILVVDDEEEMLKALEDLLESLGYRALTTTNGSGALSAYEEHDPDAVILDRNIPGMDGVTCLKRILDMDANAKVILISGYDQEGPNGIDRETRDTIAGYLTKPLDVAELSHVMGRLFEDEVND